MNSIATAIYLVHVLDMARTFAGALAFISLIALVVCLIGWIGTYDAEMDGARFGGKQREKSRERSLVEKIAARVVAPLLLICAILMTVIPGKDTLYMIVGAHYGEEVLTSEGVSDLGSKGIEYLDELIDQRLEDLREEAKDRIDETGE